MTKPVYMDYNATTPLHPELRKHLLSDSELYANASSMHASGREARGLVEQARSQLAALIKAPRPESLIFTSGGSESNNTVFQSMAALKNTQGRDTVVVSAIEHPCVLNAAAALAKKGLRVIKIPVDGRGIVDAVAYHEALDERTLLVSIMAGNNEIGTVQDIAALAASARKVGAFFHCDAVQAAGKLPVDVQAWGVDYLSLSAHKIYGPKGVGALYVRPGSPMEPFIRGGHQENGWRAGTYNTQGIIGFGRAAELAQEGLEAYKSHVWALREGLREGILAAIPSVRVNGHPLHVLPNTLNCSFPGAEGEAILLSLDLEGIEVSTGSACASGSLDPSHVLMATGVGPELAHGSIRFSLGSPSTQEDVDRVLAVLPPVIARLRRMSTVNWRESHV